MKKEFITDVWQITNSNLAFLKLDATNYMSIIKLTFTNLKFDYSLGKR